ncbi:MAG: AAA family ATPase [Prevotella sp.]|nr:AAA family ATPase [Prevotella sp.]
MEQKKLKKCPVGIQTFSEIIENNYLYIDKTEYVYNLTHGAPKYFFLSRPRRFGKSLLTSTLHSYFDGQKELFKGLAIEKLEKEWTQYPVLHFDMSLGKHLDKDALERYLARRIAEHEEKYGITEPAVDNNDRLTALIRRAYEQTGQKVVVLIDEYDAPLLDVMHEEENLPVLRNVMRNFYSPLKACDPYLRCVFLTGITKFSQLSIFSELNNITNISMFPEYAGICGITKEELLTQMSDYIDNLAAALKISREETIAKLTAKYDGYHFTWPSPDVFNPFSLLKAFTFNRIEDYWFESGTPTYLIEMLRKYEIIPSRIGNITAMAADFDAPTERITSIVPLLYQSGYVTIKKYNEFAELYTLDIPNGEIRVGLMNSLLPYYVQNKSMEGRVAVAEMYDAIRQDRMEEALELLKAFLLTVPECDNTNYEGHYQQMFYIIFSLLGRYVDVEVRTATGRVDMVMRTATKLYLIELKINQSAAKAMNQINLKDYPARFAIQNLPVVKVGINFSTKERTITDWDIDE